MTDRPQGHRLWVHLGLFLLTCLTTTAVGMVYAGPPAPDFLMGAAGFEQSGFDLQHWWRAFLFSGPLMFILLTHEMGHYIAARRHGVDVSLPYFIPVPFGLGTFGAVIAMREKVRSRDALMDIGAAGPLAGLAVAVPLLIIGLWYSPVGPALAEGGGVTEGNSILYVLLKYVTHGELLPSHGRDVFLNPLAWAAWVGLLVTMLNLIPIGQFDGGHVAFAYFGDRYRHISRWVHRSLPVIGAAVFAYVFQDSWRHVIPLAPPTERAFLLTGPPGSFPAHFPLQMPWLNTWQHAAYVAVMAALPFFVWAFLARILGAWRHPAVHPAPLSLRRRALGIVVFVVFVLTVMPIPLREG